MPTRWSPRPSARASTASTPDLAWQAVYKDAMTPPDGDTTRRWLDREEHTPYEARAGLTYYKQLGYIPTDKTDEAASSTLEDSYDDWWWRRSPRPSGNDDDYRFFLQRSLQRPQPLQPRTGFMKAQNADGTLGRARTRAGPKATSGSTLFAALHDMPGVIQLMGGPEATPPSSTSTSAAATTSTTTSRATTTATSTTSAASRGRPRRRCARSPPTLYEYARRPRRRRRLRPDVRLVLFTAHGLLPRQSRHRRLHDRQPAVQPRLAHAARRQNIHRVDAAELPDQPLHPVRTPQRQAARRAAHHAGATFRPAGCPSSTWARRVAWGRRLARHPARAVRAMSGKHDDCVRCRRHSG